MRPRPKPRHAAARPGRGRGSDLQGRQRVPERGSSAQASAYGQFQFKASPDPDLKVRTALDRAAEKIETRFANQPAVEAAIRQVIGTAYLELGLFRKAEPHLTCALCAAAFDRPERPGNLYRHEEPWISLLLRWQVAAS